MATRRRPAHTRHGHRDDGYYRGRSLFVLKAGINSIFTAYYSAEERENGIQLYVQRALGTRRFLK